jgi:hypothetical protein
MSSIPTMILRSIVMVMVAFYAAPVRNDLRTQRHAPDQAWEPVDPF